MIICSIEVAVKSGHTPPDPWEIDLGTMDAMMHHEPIRVLFKGHLAATISRRSQDYDKPVSYKTKDPNIKTAIDQILSDLKDTGTELIDAQRAADDEKRKLKQQGEEAALLTAFYS